MGHNSYHDIIASNIEGVYRDGIATKILQHMERIRNISDITQARRWVMELLQNARDCAYEDIGVRVRVELKDNELDYSHNGKPFRIKDVLSIINQVTSKASSEESVGKFGTGFMTTFQLSDFVTISSVLKDDDLPYKRFKISMDRSSLEKDGILEGISDTLKELDTVDDHPEITDFDRENYNTVFCYPLKNAYHYNIAKTGFDDLKETILYVMLFSIPLRSIELISHDGGEKKISYSRGEDCETGNAGLRSLTINVTETMNDILVKEDKNHILYYCRDGITLAAAYDDKMNFKAFSDKLPRIFADFPLIGAEAFPFPVIVNDRSFKVNEPRSGITLVDNENSPDAALNKKIMTLAVIMYEKFLNEAVALRFRSIENIVEIAKWRENNEISENWIKSNVYGKIYSIASSIEMIETEEGRKALADGRMRFPAPVEETENDAETIIRVDPWKDQEDKKAALGELLSDIRGCITPVGEECWLKAFSGYEQHKDKKITLYELSGQAEELLKKGLDEEKVKPMEWLQKLYNACCSEKSLNTAIAAGQVSIFPSQDEEDEKNKKLYPIGEIYIDNDIPEILKDITEELDRLDNFEALRIRKNLINKDFHAKHTEIKQYPVERISEYISKRSARSYRVRDYYSYHDTYIDAWHKAWDKLVSCGPDEDFYRMAACIKENPNEYKPLEADKYERSMWKSAYCSILEEMASEIEETSNIDGFVSENHSIKDSEEACRFITDFVKCAKRYLGQLDNEIYPDQNGVFKNSRNLKIDAMKHEVLKDIMEVFSDTDEEYAIRKKLLDKRITETFQPIPDYKDSDAASKISNRIDGLLSSASLSEAEERYQEACGKLLYWIRGHIEEARTYFPSYYGDENQMKLLTPHAASILQKKADQMDDIMGLLKVSSHEELVKKIEEYEKLSSAGDLEETNDDPLIGGGYASEYDVFIGPDFADADEDVLREIGVGGEKYALEQVVRNIRERGFETIDVNEGKYYRLKKLSAETGKNEIVEVRYADHGNYHQSGYDISVTESVCGESDVPEESKVYYLEVKTHTPGSRYRNKIILSQEQMKLAASKGENYSVLNVVYDYNLRQGVSFEELKNPILLIGKGKLAGTQKKYEFVLSEVV